MAEIFITRRVFREAIGVLEREQHAVEINDSDGILPTEELIQRARGKAGIICLLNDSIDSQVMDRLPWTKVISNIAVGYDNIDVEAATRRGIMVTNTPGVLTETTAELAFALLLAVARRIKEADTYVRAGRFESWELMQPHMGIDVHGKTLGIVAMGEIGNEAAFGS